MNQSVDFEGYCCFISLAGCVVMLCLFGSFGCGLPALASCVRFACCRVCEYFRLHLIKWFMSVKSFGDLILLNVYNSLWKTRRCYWPSEDQETWSRMWGACASEEISSLCRVLWVQIILKRPNSQKYDHINMSRAIFSAQVTEIGGRPRRRAGTDYDIS